MTIINQTMEYALSDTFYFWFYVITISLMLTPLLIATWHDCKYLYRKPWINKSMAILATIFIVASTILIICSFTCTTWTGYYEYTVTFDNISTQNEVLSHAKDIEYVNGGFKFKSMIDYGGLK